MKVRKGIRATKTVPADLPGAFLELVKILWPPCQSLLLPQDNSLRLTMFPSPSSTLDKVCLSPATSQLDLSSCSSCLEGASQTHPAAMM